MTTKFKVTDDVKDAQLVVCAPATEPLYFPDNVRGVCSFCGLTLQHRPHIPAGVPLACMACAAASMGDEDHTIVATPRTMREVELFFRKN